ncbi:MAG: ABC transporter permease [Candidatus Heimdallarchaeum endolithica]|uniref:ABC transporter permease n=1 Tax=Candidatus Heimdallarchaeum endolithica TaxID=2876572 RepID=A0A9Y1BR09_9ARCH|nr:MAG: ABC transporter permease [Candidatus Heimdallarchaeum endolithica]
MAIWRLVKNSIRFAFRAKKRWITFVIIFALLSAFVTLFVSTFNGYSTEKLMSQKGFYIKAAGTSENAGTVTEQQGNNFYEEIIALTQVEKVTLFRYFDLGNSVRIFSVEPDSRWMFLEAKPSKIVDGKYITKDNEALVSLDASITADIGNISASLSATLHKGEVLSFKKDNNELDITIVGEIEDTINAPGKFKLFVSDTTFDQIQEFYSDNSPVFCYSIAILVKGDLFKPFNHDIKNNIETLSPQSSIIWINPDDPAETSEYGVWAEPLVPDARASEKQRLTDFLYFFVGILGGMILVLLYNALIVWFRKREIAVLRAMGYKKREIRINLLGESLTISLLGFIIGLSAMLIYFWTQGLTFTNQVITPLTLLMSFGIVVGLSIPGLLISSVSFTRVNPILLFKAR